MSAIDTTSPATGQPQGAQAPEVPVVRITPPTRWWVLPLAAFDSPVAWAPPSVSRN